MLEKLKEIIADQLNVDADSITAESRFKEDLEADSLDLNLSAMRNSHSNFKSCLL